MKRYRIAPGSRVRLARLDPSATRTFDGNKAAGREAAQPLNQRLRELQELLFAEGKHRVLIVLQGMDTSGKDGTIRHVFQGVNPQGVHVASFKKPSPLELSHDYLWRIHRQTPADGQIVIFNRSHYEDVLVVRVHSLVPKAMWSRRYDQINAFERQLTDEGTTILKFFLHIDRDEQKARLQSRLDRPDKHWKFNAGDLAERKLWPAYTRAYEAVLGKTSTAHAPWFVIPANRKWYRNLVITRILVDTLESLKMSYPKPEADLDSIVIE